MVTPARSLVSEEEYLALPESNQPMELIDGEVMLSPSPELRHQRIVTRMVVSLERWVEAERAEVTVTQSPLDVRLGPGRIVQPDVMVFMPPLPVGTPIPIDQIPTICIEVLSRNTTYDRVTKRYLYAEAGVREYWVVDPVGAVERRTGEWLRNLELCEERLTTPLLPGFSLELRDIFTHS
jgi:Uma2 family endonuclease